MKILGRVCAVAVTGLIASPAGSQKLSLKFGHVGEPGSLVEASANEFARCANADLGDKAEVQVFGSSQLGSDTELLQKLKLGQVQFALPSSVMSSVDPTFGIFEMPYIIKSRERSEEHTSELQSLMRISYAVFCLKKKKTQHTTETRTNN